jgi:glycosyltransferase involved in cell wall biosynthesis
VQFKRYDLAIINRSFWPKNQIIGESLLQLGESASDKGKDVVIITQHTGSLKKIAEKFGRGSDLLFRSCKSRSDSSTKLMFRIIDAVVFMLWVFWNLLVTRPKNIYVSTDPPLIVPFVVFIYSKISKASYVYHLQDIHPEAANIVVKLNPMLFSFLKKIDGLVIRHALSIITITQTMKDEIVARSNAKSHIYLIDNPTASFDRSTQLKIKGFIFSGNLGRLQRIPLLLKSIDKYKAKGGILPFLFIGRGVYANEIQELSKKYTDIEYGGLVDAKKANELTLGYEWALLPIDDEVTKYAFPSKTSSYVSCGVKILSICSNHTSVAKWVLNNNYGINSLPNVDDLVGVFFEIENGLTINNEPADRDYFSIERFVQNISNVVFNTEEVVG